MIPVLILALLVTGCSRLSLPMGPAAGPAWASSRATPDDAFTRTVLSGAPPRTVFEVRRTLEGLGGTLTPHLVANRGHANPEAGSFSVFETYTGPMRGGTVSEGELFIGYFSERQGDVLAIQQSYDSSLMIEVIAWDKSKRMFNFWELEGNGAGSEWKYRGDSEDVLADVETLNLGAPAPRFGSRLRCSGCHTQGGPIMKELEAPNNDWWTTQGKLELGSLRLEPGPDPSNPRHLAATLFQNRADASSLSRQVKRGLDRLIAARRPLPLRHELRALFTTMEMQLASDRVPYRERQGGAVEIPRGFFVDERLAGPGAGVPVDAGRYAEALERAGSRFAPGEADLPETHHAFVVPVRSYVDNRVIDRLTASGVLDAELVADVLAVDVATPVYSKARASLLAYVPAKADSAAELREGLIANLKGASEPAAQELLRNLSDPTRTAAFHRKRAIALLEACRRNAPQAVAGWVALASQRREELRQAETARNPRGRIDEPGFRVIFPEDRLSSTPGRLGLSPETGLVSGR